MMLSQYGFVQAGVQAWSLDTITSNGTYIAYASTLSVFIYRWRRGDPELFDLQPCPKGEIKGIAMHPKSPHLAILSSVNEAVTLIDIKNRKVITTMSLKDCGCRSPLKALSWRPSDSLELAVLSASGNIYIVDFVQRNSRRYTKRSKQCCLRFSHNGEYLAIGGVKLAIVPYGKEKAVKEVKPFPGAENFSKFNTVVVDWDPLSNNYVLAVSRHGNMCLIAVETGDILTRFSTTVPIVTAVFSLTRPGEIWSVSGKSSALQKWNVSRPQCISMQATTHQASGALSICNADEDNLLFSLKTGGFYSFNLNKKDVAPICSSGHSETVFTCAFAPHDAEILITGSYDGAVKLWNVNTFKEIYCFLNKERDVVYNLCWGAVGSPYQGKFIAAYYSGNVILWDANTYTMVKITKLHAKQVFGLDWNQDDPNLIVTSSEDGNICISRPDGSIVRRLKMNSPCCMCKWNPYDSSQIVVGCRNSSTVVLEYDSLTLRKVKTFKSQTQRVFGVAFSPILKDFFACGSDDGTIAIHNITNEDHWVLKGHTNNVRGLIWHSEIPHYLLSGSWDATIRLWDVSTLSCIFTFTQHLADVYCFTYHPSHPFRFISSSRDSRCLFTQLNGPVIESLRLLAFTQSNDFEELLGNASDLNDFVPGKRLKHPCKLYGRASKALANNLRQCNEIDRLSKLIEFFYGADGLSDFCRMLRFQSGKSVPRTQSAELYHQSETQNWVAPVKVVNTFASRGSSFQARQNQIEAYDRLFFGDLHAFVESCKARGEWDKALALSPGLGIDVWKANMREYALQVRETERISEAAPYMMCADLSEELVSDIVDSDPHHSFILSCQVDNGTLPSVEVQMQEKSKKIEIESKSMNHRVDVALKQAQKLLREARPIKAAAWCLAVDEIETCIEVLEAGYYFDIAFAVSRLFRKKESLQLREAIISRLKSRNLFKECLPLCKGSHELTLLAISHEGDPSQFYTIAKLCSVQSFLHRAKDLKVSPDAILAFAAGRDTNSAVQLALQLLDEALTQDPNSWETNSHIYDIIEMIPQNRFSRKIFPRILVHCIYKAMHRANANGFLSLANFFRTKLKDFLLNGVHFPLNSEQIFSSDRHPNVKIHQGQKMEMCAHSPFVSLKTEVSAISGEDTDCPISVDKNIYISRVEAMQWWRYMKFSLHQDIVLKPFQ